MCQVLCKHLSLVSKWYSSQGLAAKERFSRLIIIKYFIKKAEKHFKNETNLC
jgi:hypothetical protein